MRIIPAVLPHTFKEIESAVQRVGISAPWVQIDICDGVFVPSQTWPYTQGGWQSIPDDLELPLWQDVNYEFDLMVSNPEMVVEKIMEIGGLRAVLHLGSTQEENILKALRALEHYDMEAVIAINNDYPLEELFSLIEKNHQIHAVQCMGIHKVGFQKQSFDERVLERIRIIKQKYPNIIISVDGAVNASTVEQLISSGADRLVSGSFIFESGDAVATIQELENLF